VRPSAFAVLTLMTSSNVVVLDRQITWSGALEDLIHVDHGLSDLIVRVHRIGHEPARVNKLTMTPHRRHPTLGSEAYEDVLVLEGQYTWDAEHRMGTFSGHRGKATFKVGRFTDFKRLQGETQRRRRLLELCQYEHIGPIGRIVENRDARHLGGDLLE
jgi:hypothetical protein